MKIFKLFFFLFLIAAAGAFAAVKFDVIETEQVPGINILNKLIAMKDSGEEFSTEEIYDGVLDPSGSVKAAATARANQALTINGQMISGAEAKRYFGKYAETMSGPHWYDGTSGLYGVVGDNVSGVAEPNLPFAAVSQDASGGTSGVIVNGRELNRTEQVTFSTQLGTILRGGDYWLTSTGELGKEGEEEAMGELNLLFGSTNRSRLVD